MRRAKSFIGVLLCVFTLFSVIRPSDIFAGEVKDKYESNGKSIESEARVKLLLLKELAKQAEDEGYDTERENCTIWMSEQFLEFADYDDLHIKENKYLFDCAPMYKTEDTKKLANELPNYERSEVLKMLEKSINDLQDVISGKNVRKTVNKVDWDNIMVKDDQFYNSNGKPVFLYDYFSKAHGADQDDPNLYNDYLGNIAHPLCMSAYLSKKENGGLTDKAYSDIIEYENKYLPMKDNIGYMMLWHSGKVIPEWFINKYGKENVTHGIPKYTQYDIDNPNIRNVWSKVIEDLVPKIKDKNYLQLGYILSNEPHWYADKDSYFVVKNGISDETLSRFRSWLQKKHNNDINELNQLWETDYNNFDEITISIPIDVSALRGTPKMYDYSRFNMERVTDWFTFLHDNIKKYDEDAYTHLKIMPKIFTDNSGSRDHGIDVEALTNLTEYIGNDATIRKQYFNSREKEDWEKDYAYYWREIAMTYDILSSMGPDKINVNSESHFISTTRFRDNKMEPEYVRSTYWLATILGMNANLTWYWGRYGDGSIEPRILADSGNLAKGYPGSCAQMPRVANEYTQTMMDLNAFSTDIVKFQRQEKPIRIYYSETANINDEEQINRLFNLYESMYFNGLPIGFATKDIIRNKKEDFDEIVIYDTPCVTDDEFLALQEYLDNGGTIIVDNKSLIKNEYNQFRTLKLNKSKGKLIKVNNGISNISTKAFDLIDDKKPLVNVEEINGSQKKGCIWRVVDGDGADNKLVTIINVGKSTAQLDITNKDNPNAVIIDMLTGKEMSDSITLPSEGVLFLNVGSKVPWARPDTNHELRNPVAVASAFDEFITLNWLPTDNADSYKVYSVNNNNYELLEKDINDTCYQITDLLNNVEYTYIVTAENEEGESDIEEAVKLKVIPVAKKVPDNPTYIKAEALDSGIRLSWNPVDDAEKYKVYLKDSNNYKLVKEGIVTDSTVISPLVNGKEYTFIVTSVQDGLESDKNTAYMVKAIPKAEMIPIPEIPLKSVLTHVQENYFSFDTYKSNNLTKPKGTQGKWWINDSSIMSVTTDKSYTKTGKEQSILFNGDPALSSTGVFFATTPNAMGDKDKPELPADKYYIEAMIFLEEDYMSNIDISYVRKGKGVMNAKLSCSTVAEKGKWVKVKSTVLKAVDGTEINEITKDLQLKFIYPKTGLPTEFYIDNIRIMKEDKQNI
ncbi:hypothetical protein SH1V18_06890 [Vallitalea longa]|uniref:Fibronectin type-III domain-containing protein n=1 Tax=Vallitalea longa TaxID=2936439 RepID=A0A9W5YA57_9FIRM|nr:beta-galactosidase [Vallitalea longa]GKX28209.1 hypothetical protein SH1V18_06890 [Vallitalea longa]